MNKTITKLLFVVSDMPFLYDACLAIKRECLVHFCWEMPIYSDKPISLRGVLLPQN